MCMAQPVQQKDPSNPAPYALKDNYGQVTSNWITPDGVTHGTGTTVAQQYAEKQSTGTVRDPNAGVVNQTSGSLFYSRPRM